MGFEAILNGLYNSPYNANIPQTNANDQAVAQTASILGSILPQATSPGQLAAISSQMPTNNQMQAQEIANQAGQMQNEMGTQQVQRSALDLAADYPFLAKNLPMYPQDGQQGDIDKFMQQLKTGRQASLWGGLGGNLDALSKIMGINKTAAETQKTQDEAAMNSPSAIIGGAKANYKFSSIPNENNPNIAAGLKNMPEDQKKTADNIEMYTMPALENAQNIINMSKDGIPKYGEQRDKFNSSVANLKTQLLKLRMNGQMRFSGPLQELANDMEGDPGGWQTRWLRTPDQIKSTMQLVQGGTVQFAQQAYPSSLGDFNYDALKAQTSNANIQHLIDQTHQQNKPNDTVNLQYNKYDGSTEVIHNVPRWQIGAYQNEIKNENSKLPKTAKGQSTLAIQPSGKTVDRTSPAAVGIQQSGFIPNPNQIFTIGKTLGQLYDSLFGNKYEPSALVEKAGFGPEVEKLKEIQDTINPSNTGGLRSF